jgi:hypothetical protein
VPTSSISSAGHHVHCLLLILRFSSFTVWALLCPMISATTHYATLVLLILLLLFKGSRLR